MLFEDRAPQRPRRLAVRTSCRGRDVPSSTPGVDAVLHAPLVAVLFRAAPAADATARGSKTVCPSGLRGWTQAPQRKLRGLKSFAASWPRRDLLCCAGGIPRLPASRQLGRVAEGAGFRSQPARSWVRVPQLSLTLASLWCLLAKRRFSTVFFPLARATIIWPSGLRRWLKAAVRKGLGSNPAAVTRFALCLPSARALRAKRSRRRTCHPRLRGPMPFLGVAWLSNSQQRRRLVEG